MNVLEKILEEMEEKYRSVDREQYDCSELSDVEDWYDAGDIHGQLVAYDKCMDIVEAHVDRSNVLEQILEEIENEAMTNKEIGRKQCEGMARAMNIIRSHMDEAENDGWIPVEERLPEVPEGLADEYCPEFNVTIKGAERTTTLKYSWDGTWFDDNGNVYNVIAWQLLPEPYKSKKTIPVAGMDHIMSRFTKVE